MPRHRHYVIFVPGLADKTYAAGLKLAFFLWISNWLKPFYFTAHWSSKKESFTQKLERLTDVIDHAVEKGYTVSLVAASAGSSLALNAFYKRPERVHRVVSVVGKLKRREGIAKALFELNPAFEDSIKASEQAEAKLTPAQRRRVLIVRATRDSYVPAKDGAVKGAHTFTMHTMGHVLSIILALTIYQRVIVRFIKKS